MKDISKYNDISDLIMKEVFEDLSPEDKIKLKTWIDASPENTILYSRIKSSTNFRTRNREYHKQDVDVAWDSFFQKINRPIKLKVIFQFYKYAAAILLPLLIAGGIYFHISNRLVPKTPVITQVQKIIPGSAKAVLILENGKSVLLDSAQNLSLTEEDGTLIKKSNGKLNYTAALKEAVVEPIYNTLKIPRGGEYNLVLADGTHVYLNAMSSLKYPVSFTGKNREVELTGEAYFKVSKDASRPFIVKTASMSIEVLGTTFNLNAYENSEKIVTTLVEGSVKIINPVNHQIRMLTPDQQATFNIYDGTTEIRKVDVNLYTAWKNGNFVFYDSRLEDIMTTLSRWYSANVIYVNNEIKNLKFSGKLKRDSNISEILQVMESSGKIKIKIINNNIYLDL